MEESIMVLKESRPYLDTIRQLTPRLDESLDRFTDEVKAIEAELSALTGVEVESEVIHRTGVEEAPGKTEYDGPVRYHFASVLAYERHTNNKWALTIRRYRLWGQPGGYEDWDNAVVVETLPLLQASRELRVAARDYIVPLVKQIAERLKEMTAALDKPLE